MNNFLLIFAVLVVFPALAYSHGVLYCPTPRAGMGVSPGTKHQPRPPTTQELNDCAGSTAGTPTATYNAGDDISITWDTTLVHTNAPGVRIAVSYSSSDSFNQNILADFGVDVGGKGYHNFTVTLPSGKTSNNAIIQWIWDSSSDNGYYLECADVKIVNSGGGGYQCTPTPASTNDGPSDGTSSDATTSIAQSVVLLLTALLGVFFF